MKYDFYLDMRERRSHTLLLQKIKPQSVVLELGSSTGIMTNYMKNTLHCRIYICEIDQTAIQIARLYADGSWQGDLDSMQWADFFSSIKFDYILCADVLEHLRNPEGVLKKTAGMLKENGSVLLSMPNVAHNSVVFDLIENRFDYTEVGILDQTHLKFYTYPSLVRLCTDAGYTPVEEDAIYQEYLPPDADKYPDFIKYRKYGNAFQFIFELKKTQYVQANQIPIIYKIEDPPQK
jgi:2-polyprenyl-3-methyl-5-hydroxy-6-metoxy-1,4-benzoquinol methylase